MTRCVVDAWLLMPIPHPARVLVWRGERDDNDGLNDSYIQRVNSYSKQNNQSDDISRLSAPADHTRQW